MPMHPLVYGASLPLLHLRLLSQPCPRPPRPRPPARSLQECWELLFDTIDTTHDVVRIATGVLSTIKIRADKMKSGEIQI